MDPLKMNDDTNQPTSMPWVAAILGAAGLIPFVGLALAPLVNLEPFGRDPLSVLAFYGAIILSFMGAVHWGLAMADTQAVRSSGYIVSVIPALVGWFAISFLPLPVTLRVIAAAFMLLLLFDLRAVRIAQAPAWYGRLRVPLTVVVVPALLIASGLA
jgi:Protein of unknown function (DUF3429)